MNESSQYLIIGGDGRQYGPVSASEVQQWIAEGRAGAGTQVQLVGSGLWRALGELPEFNTLTSPMMTGAPPLPAAAAQAPPAIKVFGILNIIFGGLGILCAPVGFLGIPILEKKLGPGSPALLWLMITQIAAVIGAAVQLASGIGLCRQRAWARLVAVIYAWVAIVLGAINAAVLVTALSQASAGSGPQQLGSMIGGVIGGLFGTVYYVLMIVFLGRKAVKEFLEQRRG